MGLGEESSKLDSWAEEKNGEVGGGVCSSQRSPIWSTTHTRDTRA